MAVDVVDRLEAVEVEQKHRAMVLALGRARQRLDEQPAVGQARQRIMARHRFGQILRFAGLPVRRLEPGGVRAKHLQCAYHRADFVVAVAPGHDHIDIARG